MFHAIVNANLAIENVIQIQNGIMINTVVRAIIQIR